MHSIDVSTEVYGFRCMRCGHLWERSYEVRRSVDYEGDEIVAYTSGGRPSAAPGEGNCCCPSCGGFRVRLVPQRYAARAYAAAQTSAAAPAAASSLLPGGQPPA